MKKRYALIIPALFLLFNTAAFGEISLSMDIGDELTGEYTSTDQTGLVSGYTNDTYARADVTFLFNPVAITPWVKGLFQVKDNAMKTIFYMGVNFDFFIADEFNIFLGGEYYAALALADKTDDQLTPYLSFNGVIGPFSYDAGGGIEVTIHGTAISSDIEAALSLGLEFPMKNYSWNIGAGWEMDLNLGDSIENTVTLSVETPFSFGFIPSLGAEYKSVYITDAASTTAAKDLISGFIGLGYTKGIWNVELIWQHGYDLRSQQQMGKYVVTLEISI